MQESYQAMRYAYKFAWASQKGAYYLGLFLSIYEASDFTMDYSALYSEVTRRIGIKSTSILIAIQRAMDKSWAKAQSAQRWAELLDWHGDAPPDPACAIHLICNSYASRCLGITK